MASFGRSVAVASAVRRLMAQSVSRVPRRGYAAEANQMSFTFAAPSGVFYNAASVRQIDVPSFSGCFGILPNHVPTLAVLKPGVVAVTEDDGNVKKYFVSSGSVTVNADNSVQVLAEEAVTLDAIDGNAARETLQWAQGQLSAASDDVAKAEVEIAIEVAEALVKAASE